MKTKSPRYASYRRLILVTAIFVSLLALAIVPNLNSSASSVSKIATSSGSHSPGRRDSHRRVFTPGRRLNALSLAFPQPPAETIATFAADCTTPRTTFVLGETVCAKTDNVTETDRFVNWCVSCPTIDYGGAGVTDIDPNNQPQNFSYTPTVTGSWKATIADPSDSSIIPTVFTVVAPQPLATYAPDCVTPKSTFNLGDVVCARVSNLNLDFSRSFSWVDPEGFGRQVMPITNSNQTNSYTLPSTDTSLISGIFVVDNRGTWKINVVSSRNSVVFSQTFQVQGASPTADLSIVKSVNGGDPDSGTNFSYNVAISNTGANA